MSMLGHIGVDNRDVEVKKNDGVSLLKRGEVYRITAAKDTENMRFKSRSGVTIITATNRPHYMEKVFANYKRQVYKNKELIVVLNNNQMNIEEWKDKANQLNSVRVLQLDENKTLADCLNLAVSYSNYPYISKCDDDNYYAPKFITDLMDVFNHTHAHIVGKRAYYTYLENRRLLILRFPSFEHCYVRFLSGSAMIVKKEVFEKVRFTPVIRGTDTIFLKECVANNFKIYSADRFNYVYVRKLAGEPTTWPIEEEELLAKNCQIIGITDDYYSYVTL